MSLISPYILFPDAGPVAKNVLFVVADSTTLTSQETAAESLMTADGWTVTRAEDSDASYTLTGIDVVVISDSITPGTLSTKLLNATVGVMSYDRGIVSEMEGASGDAASMTSLSTTNVVTSAHPITSTFGTGSITLLTTNRAMADILKSALGSGATVLTDTPGDSTRAMTWVYASGAGMDGGFAAPGRRAFLPVQQATGDLGTDGQTLYIRALNWTGGFL